MRLSRDTSLFPLRQGTFARQAHVDLPAGTFEEEFGRQGFYGRASHLYHRHPVTAWTRIEGPLRPRSYDLNRLEPGPDEPAFRPIRLLHNPDVALSWVRPRTMDFFCRDADGDEVYFIHAGGGRLECSFGVLDYAAGDYLVIPRGTTYRFLPGAGPQGYLRIESAGEILLPDRNQLGPHALFDPAVIDTPVLAPAPEDAAAGREWAVHVQRRGAITRVFYPFNPMDVVGWKGDLTVWRINVLDIRPVTSPRYHLPHSAHTTFLGRDLVICSFLPRPFEQDPGALRVPFYHANIDFDEVLFYSAGHFFSREGIGPGMLTWHPQGIHHGPHPRAAEAARGQAGTDEVAVMVDTARPLRATAAAAGVEQEGYWGTWR